MFIATGLPGLFAAPEERNVVAAILAYNIPLLWGFGLREIFRIYKHSAPPKPRAQGCHPLNVICRLLLFRLSFQH